MKALIFNGIGDIRLENVREPKIKDPLDAIVRITASAICGTDLHMVRGTMTGMKAGTILGHEGVGIVEEVGDQVRNFKKGDRVVIASTISCGYCSYCRTGYFAQCDHANPTGKGTAFFGGPADSGPIDGMQAEWVRVPYANVGMVRIPDGVSDDQAILLSDIFPTGYFGAHLAEIKPGNTVAVFGCGPVGQFAILSAFLRGAGRVFAIDRIDSRLKSAQNLNAEIINFDKEAPINVIRELTGGVGVDRVIDAVGIDAVKPAHGPALKMSSKYDEEYKNEVKKVAPHTHPKEGNWIPGNAPSQTLRWAVDALAKAGTLSIIGVYPATAEAFPIGIAMNKNLTINMGNCNHRRYIPDLLDLVQRGTVKPEEILTKQEPLLSAIDAYRSFDKREEGWLKVELLPSQRTFSEELVPYVAKD
jgi:threonine dehydrogenase-like Zn-dependent dehydrogenase